LPLTVHLDGYRTDACAMDHNSFTEVVYDDDELRVIWHPGQTDFVLITFGDLITPAEGHRYFADKPAHKGHIAALGIVAKSPNWYPAGNVLNAYQAIWSLIRDYAVRVAYGGSMGGYAAIKFSRLFGATQVIALCPQWSLDPAECEGQNPGWQGHLRPDMTGMGIRAADIQGDVFLFVDRLSRLDMFHCGRILEACPGAEIVNVPCVGHNVTSVFAGTDNLQTLIAACRARDLPALRRFSRRTRRTYPLWRKKLVETAIARFPKASYGRLMADGYRDRAILRQNLRHLPGALTAWVGSHGSDAAIALYRDIRDICDPVQQMTLCAQLCRMTGSGLTLETAHGTALVYDLAHHRCAHKTSCAGETEYYVGMEIFGRFAALHVLIGAVRFYLSRDSQRSLSIPMMAGETRNPFVFAVEATVGGTFALKDPDAYLSAEPGGRIVGDRKSASAWERFSFGVHRHG
jgi:hypothetical protein